MEEYKTRMINEAVELKARISKLHRKIDEFSKDFSFDPIELALMKQQVAHMNNYFGTLLVRAEMTFKADEYKKMEEAIDGSK